LAQIELERATVNHLHTLIGVLGVRGGVPRLVRGVHETSQNDNEQCGKEPTSALFDLRKRVQSFRV
jgi:hypothetical protein